MIQIDNIIFDIDGTLIDGRKDIVDAVNFTLKRMGLPERPFDLIVSHIGTGIKDLLCKSIDGSNNSLTDKGIDIYSDYYLKHITPNGTTLYPHVREVLDYFKRKRKFVITNRYRRSAETALGRVGIKGYFEDILGADDESCKKPSNCPVDRLTSGLNIDRERTIIVGDMDIDVMTGKNSGLKTCWVTYGLGKKEEVEGLRPDYIIDDLLELKDIID